MSTRYHRRICSGVACLLAATGTQALEWQPLFDGETLEGWSKEGGSATYRVEDGTIVGESRMDTPNTFLVTAAEYGDFILEYEILVDPGLNSGVQIRNNLGDRDIVSGYQVEVDTSVRAFTGGIYDEQRRQWLYPLSRNEKGRAAFRHGEWNRFRVEAIGDTLNVWVNDIQTARVVDEATDRGFIGLQVHSIATSELAGRSVRWRNLRILTEGLETERRRPDPGVVELSYLVNRLSDYEKRHGWRLLWDGETRSGWQGARLDAFPPYGWTIEDGVLTVEVSDGGEASGPGDIVTVESFGDFELELEFRITEGANSGIKYFVDPDLNRERAPPSAVSSRFLTMTGILTRKWALPATGRSVHFMT